MIRLDWVSHITETNISDLSGPLYTQSTRRIVAATAILVSGHLRLAAQTVMLSDENRCLSCHLEVRLLATLGRGGQFSSRPYPNTIAGDTQGRYFIGFPETQGEPVWVFDRRGQLMTKLGRSGSGPGEFREVRAVRITTGDTLRVYDGSLGRVTVFGPDLMMTRTEPAPTNLWDILWFADGSVVVSAEMRTAPRIGLPLHLVSRDGKITKSFGAKEETYSPRYRRKLFRWLSPAPGGFWSATYAHSYQLQRFNVTGQELAVLERRAGWFPWSEEYWFPTKSRPGAPELYGVAQGGDSVLWVVGRTGDKQWHEGLSAPIRAEGQDVYPWSNYEKVFDSVIEAVALPSHRFLAQKQFDGVFFSVFRDGRAGMIRESPDGEYYVEIYQLRLYR